MAKSVGLVCSIVLAFIIAVGCAVAGEAYDRNGRLIGRSIHNSNSTSSVSSVDGRLLYHNVKHGNITKTYDTNGRLVAYGIRRGNVNYTYDGNGRFTGRGVMNSSNTAFRYYDRSGRYVASGSR